MSAVLLIAAANVRRFVRNRSFFVVAILAPFAIMAALSATIGPALSGEFRPEIAIADEIGRGALDELVGDLRRAGFDDLVVVESEAEARRLVDDGDIEAAIVYSTELARSLQDPGSQPAAIVVVADASADIARDVAGTIAEQSARTFDTIRVLSALDAPIDDLSGPLGIVDDEPVDLRVLRDGTYFAVGMASYFSFFAASGFVATIHRERRESTLARMLVAPIGRAAPLLGKGLAAGVVALLSYAVLVISSTALLGANWGPPVGVLAVGLALGFAAVAVAMAVASVTSSEEAAGQVGTVLATGWAIFGGVFLELPSSGPLSAVSWFSPFTWVLDAIGLNAGSGSTAEVLSRALIIAAFGAAGLAVAFGRRDRLSRI